MSISFGGQGGGGKVFEYRTRTSRSSLLRHQGLRGQNQAGGDEVPFHE